MNKTPKTAIKRHRSAVRFKQSEIERTVRAMRAENVRIERIEVDPNNGRIIVIPATDAAVE